MKIKNNVADSNAKREKIILPENLLDPEVLKTIVFIPGRIAPVTVQNLLKSFVFLFQDPVAVYEYILHILTVYDNGKTILTFPNQKELPLWELYKTFYKKYQDLNNGCYFDLRVLKYHIGDIEKSNTRRYHGTFKKTGVRRLRI